MPDANHRQSNSTPPLEGAKVLEFGTLLPGPMTGLMLAEAGAIVVKIERPPHGDPMRAYEPKIAGDSVHFHALNRGKTSLFLDLKDRASQTTLAPLLEQADILIEQFRPGVMTRLGLGYDAVREINPRIIYCSLTGWGQTGPRSHLAGHDLNFVAASGLLDRTCGTDGQPVLPPFLAGDIAGGVYPAVINILLAYIDRLSTGQGTYLDIAISDGLAAFHYDTLIPALMLGQWPQRGAEQVTGASPRYQIYATADGRHLAVAAMEDRFWENFCDLIDLPASLRADQAPADHVIAAISDRIRVRSSSEWSALIDGRDVCCTVVARLEEVFRDYQSSSRRSFGHAVNSAEGSIPALPLPIVPHFRSVAAYVKAASVDDSTGHCQTKLPHRRWGC